MRNVDYGVKAEVRNKRRSQKEKDVQWGVF